MYKVDLVYKTEEERLQIFSQRGVLKRHRILIEFPIHKIIRQNESRLTRMRSMFNIGNVSKGDVIQYRLCHSMLYKCVSEIYK